MQTSTKLLLLYLLIFNFFPARVSTYSIHDYCALRCHNNRPSIICEEEETHCFPGNEYSIGLTDHERQLVLDYHNEIRNKVAGGLINAKFMDGTAADMNALSYSLELEFSAQCSCNQRVAFQEVLEPEMCHRSPKNEDTMLNENWSYLFIGEYPDDEFMNVVKGLSTDITLQGGGNPLLRMNWANSTELGCGKTANYFSFYVCCVYNNGGEFGDSKELDETKELYRSGPPCSECQGSDCNTNYTNLCGEILSIEDFEPPYEMVKKMRTEEIPGKARSIGAVHCIGGDLKFIFVIISLGIHKNKN